MTKICQPIDRSLKGRLMMKGKIKEKITLRALIVMLVVLVTGLSLGVTYTLVASETAKLKRQSLEEKVKDTSRLVAESAIVRDGMSGERPVEDIQPFVEDIRRQTETDYITVFNMEGIRQSHPNPELIGQPFQGGDEGPVLSGKEHFSTAEGSLGLSIRYFTPVRDGSGRQTGAVAVGVTLEQVEEAIYKSRSIIYTGMAAGLVVGVSGAFYLGRRVRKVMFGLEPGEIARLLEERSILIESTHEGIVAVDRDGRITLINEAANRLLDKAGKVGPFRGRKAEEVIPSFYVSSVLRDGKPAVDKEAEVNGSIFYVNSSPLKVGEHIIGAVLTFRDETDVKKLAERLSGTEMYAEALRAQTHEFMNKLHVILGLVHMKDYKTLAAYIEEIHVRYQDSIGYLARRIKDPIIAGFLLAKMSYSAEQGKEVVLSEDSYLPNKQDSRFTHELVTIIGNLIDNALEATPVDGRPITVLIEVQEEELIVEVKDHGKGMDDPESAFQKGVSEKGKSRGFGLHLVSESIQRLNGEIQVLSEKGKGTIIEVILPYERRGKTID